MMSAMLIMDDPDAPFQLRGRVRSVAGKFFRDCFSSRKSRAGNLQGHGSSFLLGKGLSGRGEADANKEVEQNRNLSMRGHFLNSLTRPRCCAETRRLQHDHVPARK